MIKVVVLICLLGSGCSTFGSQGRVGCKCNCEDNRVACEVVKSETSQTIEGPPIP